MCHRDFCIAKRRGVAMREIARNRIPRRLAPGKSDSLVLEVILLGGIDFRPEMLTARRREAAANDNQLGAWRGAAFRFVHREMAA